MPLQVTKGRRPPTQLRAGGAADRLHAAYRKRESGSMSAAEVWVANDDGSDIVRVAAIAVVGRDHNGNFTARLSGGEQTVVTLVAHHGPPTPDDFHLQLVDDLPALRQCRVGCHPPAA
jgi:hypothetical protein